MPQRSVQPGTWRCTKNPRRSDGKAKATSRSVHVQCPTECGVTAARIPASCANLTEVAQLPPHLAKNRMVGGQRYKVFDQGRSISRFGAAACSNGVASAERTGFGKGLHTLHSPPVRIKIEHHRLASGMAVETGLQASTTEREGQRVGASRSGARGVAHSIADDEDHDRERPLRPLRGAAANTLLFSQIAEGLRPAPAVVWPKRAGARSAGCAQPSIGNGKHIAPNTCLPCPSTRPHAAAGGCRSAQPQHRHAHPDGIDNRAGRRARSDGRP